MLAHPQRTLDLFGDPHTHRSTPTLDVPTATGPDTEPSTANEPAGGWNSTVANLYLHINIDDLATFTDTNPGTGAGIVEKLGPATLRLLRDWLHRTNKVTIRPVLDTDRTHPVDRHDPPDWMRETVQLRDGHCMFPGCHIDARACDLDHITAYTPPDDGGPPGQTNPDNLACLCRRHHRLKTLTTWTYHRTPSGAYQWTSPHHHSYLTHPTPKTGPRRA